MVSNSTRVSRSRYHNNSPILNRTSFSPSVSSFLSFPFSLREIIARHKCPTRNFYYFQYLICGRERRGLCRFMGNENFRNYNFGICGAPLAKPMQLFKFRCSFYQSAFHLLHDIAKRRTRLANANLMSRQNYRVNMGWLYTIRYVETRSRWRASGEFEMSRNVKSSLHSS